MNKKACGIFIKKCERYGSEWVSQKRRKQEGDSSPEIKKIPDTRTGSFPAMVPLARIGLAFTAYKAVVMAIILKRHKWWNLMGSNHRPLPCEGSDLPLI